MQGFLWLAVCSLQAMAIIVWRDNIGVEAAQLSESFYQTSCPSALVIARAVLQQEIAKDARAGASMLRLHFHDCFVNGCDGSILLDDKSNFVGEKTALPNLNSIRDLFVIDDIKLALEAACPGTVSCADILAIAARDAVAVAGGPSWTVLLGRRDSTIANKTGADANLPGPFNSVANIVKLFENAGLALQDAVTLSGAHSIGRARCLFLTDRLYNFSGTSKPDPTLDTNYLKTLQRICPQSGGNPNAVAPLEPVNVNSFTNQYFRNLVNQKGLLQSDQELFSIDNSGPPQSASFLQAQNAQSLVKAYVGNQNLFFTRFKESMIKLGNLSPLTGTQGQIRTNCRVINP